MMRLSEQDITNALCLHYAQRRQVKPEDVEVQLMWDEELGFSAEIWVQGRSQYAVEANMLEAIERYLFEQHGIRIFRSQIRLELDEDISAVISD